LRLASGSEKLSCSGEVVEEREHRRKGDSAMGVCGLAHMLDKSSSTLARHAAISMACIPIRRSPGEKGSCQAASVAPAVLLLSQPGEGERRCCLPSSTVLLLARCRLCSGSAANGISGLPAIAALQKKVNAVHTSDTSATAQSRSVSASAPQRAQTNSKPPPKITEP
jgi:hypothetical protein